MKTFRYFGVLVAALTLFQSCTLWLGGHGHDSDDWYWHHGGWHHGHGSDLNALESIDYAAEISRDFGIRYESAQTLMKAVYGGLSDAEFTRLGLNVSDVMALVHLEMPSQDGIAQAANALNEDPAKISAIAQSYVTGVRAQLKDVHSEYWQSCVSTGHWSTPETTDCTQTISNGCSPETGASGCSVIKQ